MVHDAVRRRQSSAVQLHNSFACDVWIHKGGRDEVDSLEFGTRQMAVVVHGEKACILQVLPYIEVLYRKRRSAAVLP